MVSTEGKVPQLLPLKQIMGFGLDILDVFSLHHWHPLTSIDFEDQLGQAAKRGSYVPGIIRASEVDSRRQQQQLHNHLDDKDLTSRAQRAPVAMVELTAGPAKWWKKQ